MVFLGSLSSMSSKTRRSNSSNIALNTRAYIQLWEMEKIESIYIDCNCDFAWNVSKCFTYRIRNLDFLRPPTLRISKRKFGRMNVCTSDRYWKFIFARSPSFFKKKSHIHWEKKFHVTERLTSFLRWLSDPWVGSHLEASIMSPNQLIEHRSVSLSEIGVIWFFSSASKASHMHLLWQKWAAQKVCHKFVRIVPGISFLDHPWWRSWFFIGPTITFRIRHAWIHVYYGPTNQPRASLLYT